MATGERIRFFRTLRGMTQKYLGLLLGFPESSADVRLAQYESEDRTPKAELTGQDPEYHGTRETLWEAGGTTLQGETLIWTDSA